MKKNEKSSGWIALRPVVWLAAVLVSAVGPPGALFVALPVAVIYTIACVFIEVADKENVAETLVSYLKRTFADIDHINSISGSDGLRFDSAQIKLEPHGGSMVVYTTAEKNRTAFLKQYHERAVAYHLCKEEKSPEELKKELMPHWLREDTEYSPECPHFFNDLRELNFEEINEGGSIRYGFKIPHFSFVCAAEPLEGEEERTKRTEIARKVITKCAEERGYRTTCEELSTNRYELTIHF
jgi:hypothetical protein